MTMKEGDRIKFLDARARLVDNYVIHDAKPNRSGLISLRDIDTGNVIRVNKRRVRPLEESGSIVTRLDDKYIAACPESGNIVLSDDGRFDFRVVGGDDTQQCSKTEHEDMGAYEEPTVGKIDYNKLASYGELWINTDVKFNNKNNVKACCVIIDDADQYVSFNTYDDTYGKKNNIPPIDDIINGTRKGYKIGNRDKLIRKLIKKGYNKY